MIAFSTTSNLLEKNKNRIEKFKENPENENLRYSGDYSYDWYNKTGLISTLDEDLN